MKPLDERGIAEIVGLSHSHVRQHIVTTPRFPKPIEIPGRGIQAGWRNVGVERH